MSMRKRPTTAHETLGGGRPSEVGPPASAQDVHGEPATEPMRFPYRCKWCGHVHDGSRVTVVQRYLDCSVWRCPNCDVLIDDRPERWGGSAIPVERGVVA